jgi:hypothetical protein
MVPVSLPKAIDVCGGKQNDGLGSKGTEKQFVEHVVTGSGENIRVGLWSRGYVLRG